MAEFASYFAGFTGDPAFSALVCAWVFMFGACVASFLNVCIWRLPRGESVSRPASHCPRCNAPIPWYLNIPILSWLVLRGRCAACGGRISIRYPLVETLGGVLFLAAWAKYAFPAGFAMDPAGSPAVVPALWLAFSGLILGTFVDIDHMYLPDRVTLGGVAAGFALSCAVPELQHETLWWRGGMFSAIGALSGSVALWAVGFVFSKILKRDAMGFGDVKLVAAAGAFFGPMASFFVVVAGAMAGGLAGIVLLAAGKARIGGFREIPFGPYLAAAAVAWAFWGPPLVDAYVDFALSLSAP